MNFSPQKKGQTQSDPCTGSAAPSAGPGEIEGAARDDARAGSGGASHPLPRVAEAACDCRHHYVGFCQRSGDCDACDCGCHRIAYEVDFVFDFHAKPEGNARLHWTAAAGKKKKEKDALFKAWVRAGKPIPPFPAVITFVRISPRELDSHDNLTSCFKYMVDELSRRLGHKDDRKAPIEWLYAQERGPPKTMQVRVEMRGTAWRGL